jgi:hypothetical protein
MSSEQYLGNPLLKKANTKIEFTKEQIEEYIKCSKDPIYFAKNYIKIVSLDEGVVPFKMYKFQEKLIRRFHKHRFNICKMPRQTGKALSLDTPIPTPNGWINMGDLNVGDTVFGKDGLPTTVIGKSEIQQIDTYEIEFDTGEVIKACGEHLWKVSHIDWDHKEKVLNTKDIIKKFESEKSSKSSTPIYININEAVQLPDAQLPIDPYRVGYLINNPYEFNGQPIKYPNTSEKQLSVEYLRSSINQRLELLRGLMDSGGSIDDSGVCKYYYHRSNLLLQVRELLSSLGIKTKVKYDTTSDGGTIRFSTTKYEVFKNVDKLNLQKNSTNNIRSYRIYIKDIRKVETEPMQCIRVDNEDHLFLCGNTFIPTHNSTTVVSYLLHFIIFNANVNIAMLANKAQTAKELLGRLQLAYENLPKWLQHGVKIWNKASLELDNGSKIIAASTSASAVRGGSYNIIFLDEFAFIPNQIADDFFSSVYPTITSGKNTKVIMVSTPKGMNSFFKFWTNAERGKNEYVPTEVHWSEVPGRDTKWKEQTIANTSKEQFEQEFECNFLGSIDTLITSSKLKSLVFDDPLSSNAGLDIYENPKEDRNYLITADVSRGTENDYHAFIIFDITSIPYNIVGKYRNNEIKPFIYSTVIHKVATSYNNAYCLIEVNDIGEQVAKELHMDLEYDNVLMCSMRGRAGQIVGQGFSGKKSQFGIKMSKQVKRVGCSNLKTIVEDDKLLIKDYDIISELTTFISKNNSFEADDGYNDDLSMCLVIFSWLIVQDYFKEMTNNDVRKRIYEEQKDQIEQDMTPFGFIINGVNEIEESFVDTDGDTWYTTESDRSNSMSHMWDYM